MMRVDVVNAFGRGPFSGNPAAVIVLDAWLEGTQMQAIAEQHNLSETAYVLRQPNDAGLLPLRWFTPGSEVRMCGHATLATAAVLREQFGMGDQFSFDTLSGKLECNYANGVYTLDFPADEALPGPDLVEIVGQALGREVDEDQVFVGILDAMLVLESAEEVERYEPILTHLNRVPKVGLIITAPGEPGSGVDVVSRCFYPGLSILEDPATGAAHTLLGPYWSKRLGKSTLTCEQASRRRGYLQVDYNGGQRVQISGQAVHYLKGEINL